MPLRRKGRPPARKPLTDAPEITTSEVMAYLGYRSLRATADWCRKHKVHAISRRPGTHGENVYRRLDVERARAAMPGRGAGGGRPWPTRADADTEPTQAQ